MAQRLLLIAAIASIGLSPLLGQRDMIQADVDLVVVPASVKDADGRLIYDLKKEDFSVFEDGRQQEIRQFSIDPAPLSAVVLVDTGITGSALRRFSRAIGALSSAFTPMDEVEAYRFQKYIAKLSDFTNDDEMLETGLAFVRTISGESGEDPPWALAVFPGRGPLWLRWLLDRNIPTRILNNAVFTAARDLERRAPEYRKIIIAISDGQDAHDIFQAEDVLARLVRDQIQFYAVTVSMPVLGRLTSTLESYAEGTGGDVYSGRTQSGMQNAFARITEQARHEYVLSYVSNNEVSGAFPVLRKIEVKSTKPRLKVWHRSEYFQYPRHPQPTSLSNQLSQQTTKDSDQAALFRR
jgi:Ca-activated chloride channel homolog